MKMTDLKNWLHDTLDSEWYWYRHEQQAKGSTQSCPWYKVEGICNLVKVLRIEENSYKASIKDNTDSSLNHRIIV